MLPVLVPKLAYDGLEITDVSMASAAFAQMIDLNYGKFDKDRIRFALLDYCRRDIEGMVKVQEALRTI